MLRWALVAAAKRAARAAAPDHASSLPAKDRLGGNRATLAVARTLTRRCSHPLGALGDQAFAPPSEAPQLGRVASPTRLVRALPTPADAPRPAPAMLLPARAVLAGPESTSGRPCVGNHPIEQHVAGPGVRGPRDGWAPTRTRQPPIAAPGPPGVVPTR